MALRTIDHTGTNDLHFLLFPFLYYGLKSIKGISAVNKSYLYVSFSFIFISICFSNTNTTQWLQVRRISYFNFQNNC